MPLYEYRCNNCQRRVAIFVQGFTVSFSPSCSRCGSKDLTRLFSTFAVHKSRSGRSAYDDILNDPKLTQGLMRNDPRALAEWSRKMSWAAGEDITPETEEMIDRMEAGEDVSGMMAPPEPAGEEEPE